jgi:uncharacterized membrane protein YfcA
MDIELLLPLLIFVIACMYSSVGHGGASGYLAILSLFGVAPLEMRSSSLLLNLIVSGIAFYHYAKAGYFNWKLFLGFAITSVPFSFLGALIPVKEVIYKKLLGTTLIFPIIKLWGISPESKDQIHPPKLVISLLVGAIIGLLSGILGIGGGIILSPLLLLMAWAGMKQTAAVSALFVFVNSISGLIGLLSKGINLSPQSYTWIAVAAVGGFVGSYLGSKKIESKVLSYLLSLVLLIAAFNLLFRN